MWEWLGTVWIKRRPELFIAAVGAIAAGSTFVAVSIKHDQARRDHLERDPASHMSPKFRILKPKSEASGPLGAHINNDSEQQNKGGGGFEMKITSSEIITQGASAAAGNVKRYHLVGSLRSLSNLDSVEYAWLLPTDVTLENGEREGSLGHLSEGQETEVEITIAGTALENRQITLHVYRLLNGEANGQVAQFNTRDEKLAQAGDLKADTLVDGSGEMRGHPKFKKPLRVQQ